MKETKAEKYYEDTSWQHPIDKQQIIDFATDFSNTENKELIKRLQESQDQEMILGMAYDKYKKENKELIELLRRSNMWHKGHLELMDEFGIKYGIKRALEDDIKEIEAHLNNKQP